MKSKKDITEQIQRIYKNHKDHRLYQKAQSIVIVYNDKMSNSEFNKKIHRLYMDCFYYVSGNIIPGREKDAELFLELMGNHKYHRCEYADPKKYGVLQMLIF